MATKAASKSGFDLGQVTGDLDRDVAQARNQAGFAVNRLQHVAELLTPDAGGLTDARRNGTADLDRASALTNEAAEAVAYLQRLLAALKN